MGRVLVVEADRGTRSALGRLIEESGHEVDAVPSAEIGIADLDARSYDVVLCNIQLPGIDGLELLRRIRLQDLDVPVVLMADAPSIPSAARALEYGAYRYLKRPLDPEEFTRTISDAVRFYHLARIRRQAVDLLGGQNMSLGDRAGLEGRFDRAVAGLYMAFQPVVSWRTRSLFGYEALLRTDEPSMANPYLFFEAAGRLHRLPELGRAVRAEVARRASEAPSDVQLFVNVHASDLVDEQLWSPQAPLSALASRVVLELTERASFGEILGVSERVAAVRRLGFRIAIDDLGAGYAGLTTVSHLKPEMVKIDMSLIRGIEASETKQSIVAAVTKLCQELGMLVVAEGIETQPERDMVAALGCDYMQGFLFGRPIPKFERPSF
jgi:EAL domain-containing protein (putative c-di-GMP-specific phosphodiesterase class I)/ActR/RegA family two-component response regulator